MSEEATTSCSMVIQKVDFWNRLVYSLYMKTTTTKQALLKAGKHLIWEKGYAATGIQEVLHAADVPKGSFYHYFDSKDAFVVAVLESYLQDLNTRFGYSLGDTTLTPLMRLRQYFEAAVSWYESLPAYAGCMLGNLSQELAAHNEPFRFRLQSWFEQWHSSILDCLQQAQECGELSASLNVDHLTDFCLNGLQGALLHAKVSQNPASLHAFLSILFERVLV